MAPKAPFVRKFSFFCLTNTNHLLMKKIFTLLFSLFLLDLGAQITYTAADGPKPGIKLETSYILDLSGFDLQDYQKTGGNQQWDISGQAVDDYSTQYIPVTNLPFVTSFPGSNMAYEEIPNPDSTYSMYQYNNSGLYLIGLYQQGTSIVFDKKVTIGKYPLQFGDNFQNDVIANFDAGGFPAQLDMKTNSVVDAWGTMKTDEGSFPVIKMKTVQLVELSVLGIPFGSQTIISHNWMANGFADPVASLSFGEFEDDMGIVNDTSFVFLKDQEVVANRDLAKRPVEFSLSPNPTVDVVTVDLKGMDYRTAVYTLVQQDGKIVASGNLNGENNFQLNVADLQAGSYLFYLVVDNKRAVFDMLNKL